MQDHAGGGDLLQKLVAAKAPLEPNPVRHAPVARSPGDAIPIGSVPEDAKHGIGVTDVAEGAYGEPTAFPGQEARQQQDVAAARARCVWRRDMHAGGVREYRQPTLAPDEARRRLVLGEYDGRTALSTTGGPDVREETAGQGADSLFGETSPPEFGEQREGSLDPAAHRPPDERLVHLRNPRPRPVRGQAHVVNHVEVDATIELDSPCRRLPLPAVVVPMEARRRQLRIELIVHVEVDALAVDPVGPGVCGDRTTQHRNRRAVGEQPDLVPARGRQQSPEPHFQFRTLARLACQGRQQNLHRFPTPRRLPSIAQHSACAARRPVRVRAWRSVAAGWGWFPSRGARLGSGRQSTSSARPRAGGSWRSARDRQGGGCAKAAEAAGTPFEVPVTRR
jgi:hypothetical protein